MKQFTLGSYIRSLRIQNELTQARLAEKLGVTDKAVSKWERDLSYPDMALFPKLADILGVTVGDLLKEEIDEGQMSRLLQIYGMSHDIRTPLNIILGCVYLAEIHRYDPDKVAGYLESIRISGEYLLRNIDQLMKYTYQETAHSPGTDAAGKTEAGSRPDSMEDPGEYFDRQKTVLRKTPDQYDFGGRRILLAEDILLNREIAAEILRQTGAEVESAEDGQEALQMVEAAPAGYYDLILMDLQMPNMDGLEATRRIRQLADPKKAKIPIIAVTANVYDKDRRAAEDAGMDDFIEKPIFTEQLLESISKGLSH